MGEHLHVRRRWHTQGNSGSSVVMPVSVEGILRPSPLGGCLLCVEATCVLVDPHLLHCKDAVKVVSFHQVVLDPQPVAWPVGKDMLRAHAANMPFQLDNLAPTKYDALQIQSCLLGRQ